MISAAEHAGSGIAGSVMLDRISRDGRVDDAPAAATAGELDRGYPLGGFLTCRLLHGDPRKVVLARSDVPLELGSHRSPGTRPGNHPLVAVHHFKWRPGITADLRRRVRYHSSGQWDEQTPAIRTEAGRLLRHLDQHDGHISTGIPGLDWRPVTLASLPDWWAREAAGIAAGFRPPARPAP
jgi:hypothetical protein